MNSTDTASLPAPRVRSNWLRLFYVALAFLIGASSISSAAMIGPTPVALSGTAAPAGGNYNTFDIPNLNAFGQVAFQANLTGGSSTSGIFAGVPGSLQVAALAGTAAPAGGNYNTFANPVLNGSGKVAYRAALIGGSSTTGIFVGAPGSVQAVALQGSPAPAGGYYSSFGSTSVINASGQVSYFAGLTDGSSTGGFFVGVSGSVQAVALQGTAAPVGGNYNSLGITPTINSSGQVAFNAGLNGGSSMRGIFTGTPGSLQAVALQGTPSPAGGNYTDLMGVVPVLNSSGQVAYQASCLIGGFSLFGIFTGAPNSMQAAALVYSAAPAGGYYNGFGIPVLNASGQVAYSAELREGASSYGIFVGAPGSLQTIALSGTATPDGVGNFDNLSSGVALNVSGQVAFQALLKGAGVSAANDYGFYAGSAGNVVKIVREGDILDVDLGAGIDLRTVNTIAFTTGSGGEDGRAMGLNDAGLLVYRLTFTDGSSGIFTSQINAVPEPGTLGLLAAGCVALLWKWRRRQRCTA